MIYVTSDTFFGRTALAKQRGFSSAQEMDNEIILNWNEKVKPSDIVWHLGNFGWDVISSEEALVRLNGTINLIPSEIDENINDVLRIQGVGKYTGYKIIESINCVLSHWPLADWPGKRNNNSLHLHGGDKEYKSELMIEKRFNVNCDLWSLSPVSIESLNEIKEMVK